MLGDLLKMEKVIEVSTSKDWSEYTLVIDGKAKKAARANSGDSIVSQSNARTVIEGGVGPNVDTYRIFGEINRSESNLDGVTVTEKEVVSADWSFVIFGGGALIAAAFLVRLFD